MRHRKKIEGKARMLARQQPPTPKFRTEPPFDRDPSNGCLVGPSGAHYKNDHDLVNIDILQQCGCGNPEDNFNLLRAALIECDRRPTAKLWVNAQETIAQLIAASPMAAAEVLMNFLTHCNLLEHGGHVGGSWLTPLGNYVVDLGPATEGHFDDDWHRWCAEHCKD